MKITFYKELSDAKEIIDVENGKELYRLFPEIDFSSRIIIVNGKASDKYYVTKDNDTCIIRSIPQGSNPWRWIGGFLSAGISEAVIAQQQAEEQAAAAQRERMISYLVSTIKKDTAQDDTTVKSLPYLKGAENEICTGKTQPYIIGKHLITPYVLNGAGSKGFHTIKGNYGENVFYNLVLEGGFNKQILHKIYTNDITLLNLSCSKPQENNSDFPKYQIASNSVFASPDSFVEISQDGEDFENDIFNKKIVEHEVNDQLKLHPAEDSEDDDDYEDLYYTLEEGAMAADVVLLFKGLFKTNASGKRLERERYIKAEYSLSYAQMLENGEDVSACSDWKPFYFTRAKHHEAVYRKMCGRYKVRISADEYWTANWNRQATYLKLWKERNPDFSDATKLSGDNIDFSKDTISIDDPNVWEKVVEGTSYYLDACFTVHDHQASLVTDEWDEPESAQYGETNLFKYNIAKEIRFNAHVDFDYDDVINLSTPITIRISSEDKKLSSSQGSDTSDCYVNLIHSYIFNKEESEENGYLVPQRIIAKDDAAKSTLIALQIESNSSNEDKLKSIQVLTSGIAHYFVYNQNTGKWEISENKTATSNIASWLYEVLTSSAHLPSKVAEEEIDIDSFGQWYDYCSVNNLNVNEVISDGEPKEEIISHLLSLGNAIMYNNIYGKLTIAYDDKQTNAIAVLNSQNLISLNYKKEFSQLLDGELYSYVSALEDYSTSSLLVMEEGKTRTDDSVVKECTIKGITDENQLAEYARRNMKIRHLRTKAVTATVGLEGIFYTPFSKVLVQHPSLKIGLGNTSIKSLITDTSGRITGLNLYEPITMESDKTYAVVVQCAGLTKSGDESYCLPAGYYLETQEGVNYSVNLSTPIDIENTEAFPQPGNILSYGYDINTATSPMLIVGMEQKENSIELRLVDYSDSLYESGEIIDYVPNLTQPHKAVNRTVSTEDLLAAQQNIYSLIETQSDNVTNGTEEAPQDITAIYARAEEDGIKLSAVTYQKTLKDVIKAVSYEISKDNGNTWQTVTGADAESKYYFDRSIDGYLEAEDLATWKVRAKGINIYGVETSSYTQTRIDVSNYGTYIPNGVSDVIVHAEKEGFRISFAHVPSLNYYGFTAFKITVKYNGTVRKTFLSYSTESFYQFDRTKDLYPEKHENYSEELESATDLSLYTFEINSVEYNSKKESEVNSTFTMTTGDYLSWLPPYPIVNAKANGRNTILYFSHDEVYGFTGYELQISKDKTNWFKPYDGAEDVKSDVELWKGEQNETAITSMNQFMQVLPLEGQNNTVQEVDSNDETITIDASNPTDTVYYYRVRTKTIYSGTWGPIVTIIAQPTSAYDLVQKTITNNKLADECITADKIHGGTITADKMAVEDLAAICGKFGKIESNAVAADDTNFWNLETGEFNIGNSTNYNNPGDEDTFFHYDRNNGIIAKIANFILTSIKSLISGVFMVKAQGTEASSAFITINPEDSESADTSTPAKTIKIQDKKTITIDASSGLVTAPQFSGDLSGNADTATKLKTARNLYIKDSASANTGSAASFDGSGNATLQLPSTLKESNLWATDSLIIPNKSSGSINGELFYY